jgi:hypothetical protein
MLLLLEGGMPGPGGGFAIFELMCDEVCRSRVGLRSSVLFAHNYLANKFALSMFMGSVVVDCEEQRCARGRNGREARIRVRRSVFCSVEDGGRNDLV